MSFGAMWGGGKQECAIARTLAIAISQGAVSLIHMVTFVTELSSTKEFSNF